MWLCMSKSVEGHRPLTAAGEIISGDVSLYMGLSVSLVLLLHTSQHCDWNVYGQNDAGWVSLQMLGSKS